MAIRVVRLGSARPPGGALRVGTVRRPPRGVAKAEFAARGFYDVWLPELAPSEALVKAALAARDEREWRAFARRYGAEMKAPAQRHLLELLAALSHRTQIEIGCYCADERRCHRSLLRELLAAHGAEIAGSPGDPAG